MTRTNTFFILISLLIVFSKPSYANNICPRKNDSIIKKENIHSPFNTSKKSILDNILPILKATGNQIYCPQTSIPIVTDINITDPDDTSTQSIYIQISVGYNDEQDLLILTGTHPSIVSKWDSNLGKLKLSAPTNGILTPYTEFIAAIKDVVYTNSSKKPTGNRTFSISIDKANYLPNNHHFYEYFEAPGITWGDAKTAAETKTYFGLKGYLATILSAEEQQIIGEQLPGNGWVGGSDFKVEGEWRWLTGPENGTMFWSNLETGPGGVKYSNIFGQGYTPNFAYWNRKNGTNNEPDNNAGQEHYAHILDHDANLGIKGSWIDLSYYGTTTGSMKSKGYIVEYGGMPSESELQIATSTTLTIPQITNTKPASRCDIGEVPLEATTNLGEIKWYENETGGSPIFSGNQFVTPKLPNTTIYYIETFYNSCTKTSERTPITATINTIPIITTPQTTFITCGPGEATLSVLSSEGETYWYEGPKNNSLVGIGTSFIRNFSTNTSYYVEAVSNGCTNGSRIKINVIVYDLPKVEDEEILWCTKNKITLDATLNGISYLWSTGENTKTIIPTAPGIFKVGIKTPEPESCTVTKTITVFQHPIPEIIDPIEADESQVTIRLKNPQNYFEYSIDGINYQSSNVFTNVTSGYQTAYVRETNSCENPVSKNFIVLIAPKYFTPNNDGFNDVWEVKGLVNYPLAEITIFDRYGKMITQLNDSNRGWDGSINKNILPATDYWYVLKLDPNSPEVKGHFSLKR
ncbi:T9SS type B sorting domain-containing protein [Flavobacterium granuli]|uniref:Gliding motility-associated-like protein n=1 Tax=Flavobacterium granuli TaxID=280093 RepID=A0ABU1S0C7_9FLAO|nr:T9SS type B sorting domain-containing protein [Flavobacterium granuli]MDR6844095.1 gliding motility-associated-like protein [Flavobacterium granuli]